MTAHWPSEIINNKPLIKNKGYKKYLARFQSWLLKNGLYKYISLFKD